ncbi:MAG: class I SAM-dependent methyltransferase [Myxococcales bacterium]
MSVLGVDLYTLKTRLSSLRWLYSIEPCHLDAFLESYVLFDGDWSHQNGKHDGHIIDYYRVLNHLCALGNVEKMYFPPLLDQHAGVKGNQELFERRMMRQIRASVGTRVLDVGCGRGRVAAHVARHSGAHVTGLNVDPGQIHNAKSHARLQGLHERTAFIQGNLNDRLPFPDASFDGGYEIQAFTYAKNKRAVFDELFRVLKPGASFSYLDWVRLPAFDPDNEEHASIMQQTREVIGAVDTPSPGEVEQAMASAGFAVTSSRDASLGGHQSELIKGERKHYGLLRRGMRLGVKAHLVPAHFVPLFQRLGAGGEAFVTANQLGLATTSYQILCRKPE